jgi:serine protease Do
MSSFNFPDKFDPNEPPPRPTTPPVRWGFLIVLAVLSLAACLVYGIPYVADRTGYAWEAGRARAASEALAKLDKKGIINEASALFREANVAVAPAVVNVGTRHAVRGGIEGAEQWDLGSGVVIDKERGFIVTNHHVVKDADDISVKLGRGAEMPARLVGADPQTDLAVIQVRGPLPFAARWGNSDDLDVGDWVLAIGRPFKLDRTVTAGIVSATGRNNLGIMGEGGYEDFIQTDAAINPGNSGGPLVDLRGTVVGINTAIVSERGSYQGIGLAISSAMAKRVVDQLIQTGHVSRSYVGIEMAPVNELVARKLGLPVNHGIVVVRVLPGSPAARAGLKPGDVLVDLEGQEINDMAKFRNQIANMAAGTKLPVVFFREGKRQTVEVTVADYDNLRLQAGPPRRQPPPGLDRRPEPLAPDPENVPSP